MVNSPKHAFRKYFSMMFEIPEPELNLELIVYKWKNHEIITLPSFYEVIVMNLYETFYDKIPK